MRLLSLLPSASPSPLVTTSTLLALLLSAPVVAGEKVAVGSRAGNGATETVYQLDLTSGAANAWQVRSGGTRLDSETVDQNLFEAIGRPGSQAAPRGSLFLTSLESGGGTTEALALIEGDTGYLGYLNRIGKDRQVGALLGAIGRPALAAAAADGSHAVVPIAAANGSTAGLYVVHGASGACVFLSNFEPTKGSAGSAGCSALPLAPSGLTAAPLRGDTPAFVLVDVTTGATWVARSVGAPTELSVREVAIDLAAVFGAAPETGPTRRYSIARVWTGSGNGVVVADAATGKLAYATGLDAGAPSIAAIPGSFVRSAGVDDPRAVLVPVFAGNGTTSGVLVFEANGASALLVTGFDGALQAQPVELRR
jgi:hypothetical protein